MDRGQGGQPVGGLDGFFDAARAEAPLPDADFMARIQAQALAEMPVAQARVAPEPDGIFAQIREALGGWKGIAGLTAACAAGLWLGLSPPEALSSYWSGQSAGLGGIGLDPASGYDLAWMEG